MENAKYLVDTSMLLRRNNKGTYDEAAFPVQWQGFDKIVERGLVVSILEVKLELTKEDHDDYEEWINNHEDIFKPLDYPSTVIMNDINRRYPQLVEQNEKDNSIADIPLVSFAKAHNLILVTHETYNYDSKMSQKKIKIPTLCDLEGAKCTMESCEKEFDENIEYDFECIDFVELVKRERLYDHDL